MDDFDIYSDLPDFAWLKETYEEDVEIKNEELPTSTEDIRNLNKKLLKLEKVHKLVLSHYSSLWKTSKQERKRMERQIGDLRRQLDNFAFKRNHRNAVPPPVSKQPQNAYPPSLFSIKVPKEQLDQENSCPPPPVNAALNTNQTWHQPEERLDENFEENVAIPSNVIITPENSHSSDESEDDVVQKSQYRSTVYGERLRKKLLEEKRNAMRQKQESVRNENKVNQEQLKHQNQSELRNVGAMNKVQVLEEKQVTNVKKETGARTMKEEIIDRRPREMETSNVTKASQQEQLKHPEQNEFKNVNEANKLHALKETEIKNMKNETDVKAVKEEINDRRQSKIETQNVKEPSNQEQKLRNPKESEAKENRKEDLQRIEREGDFDRKRREEDSRIRKENDTDRKRRDDDYKFRRERDLNKKVEDEELKMKRERDLERRKRDDESRIRRERDLDRRRRDEIEKTKREEQVEKRRRHEETENRRRDQETERRRKEEIDRRRRPDNDRRRKEEEIERRKRDEFDRRRKEEEDKKRKERELEILKQKEIERRRKEEEQHEIKLKEIEKKRNEKQLEELIKERERIENEMNRLTDNESEKDGESVISKNMSCKKQSSVEKSHVTRGKSKENSKDNSVQTNKSQSDNRRNDKSTTGQSSYENKNGNGERINDNHRNDCREYTSSKCDRQQDNHTTYDEHKYNDRRSRRDQPDRERERQKSLHRNKSRHRNKSSSGHRSDEDRSSYSPKRIKLQENDKEYQDRLKNIRADRQGTKKIPSPKRKRQTKSNEKSPQKSKKRKFSQDKNLDCNNKLDENNIQKTNIPVSKKIDEAGIVNSEKISNNSTKNNIQSTVLKKNVLTRTFDTKSDLLGNKASVEGTLENKKEQIIEPFDKDQNNISTTLTDPQKPSQKISKTENQVIDSNKDQSKLTNTVTDKKSNDHANKKKTLMNELFEAQGKSKDTPANLKNVNLVNEYLDETILSELEDGEITESDQSMNSEDLKKSAPRDQPQDKLMETIQSSQKNNTNTDEFSKSLQKNDKQAASKNTGETKDSILYNMLAHSKNNGHEVKTKVESHEKMSKKIEPVTLKDDKKSEACSKNANKAADKSSQIISENQNAVNKTDSLECRNNKSSEIIETKSGKRSVSSKVIEFNSVSELIDKTKNTVEKEKRTNCRTAGGSVTVEKTNSENSVKCVSNPTESNILINQPNQYCLKNDNSENKLENKENLLNSKKADIHSETNNVKNKRLKENVDVSNDLIKKKVGQSLNAENLNTEALIPVAKTETSSKDSAAVNTSQTKAPIRNVIVVKRRRRPVQLADSPPVIVINNNVKT